MTLRESRWADTVAAVRLMVLGIFLVGTVGIGAELLLLGHTEDVKQYIPLVLLGAGMIVLALRLVHPAAATLRMFQAVAGMMVVSGMLGVYFHYRGNVEFELEMYPTRRGLELFGEAMTGATPALAPGSMIQLGLLGLAYTFRHPMLRSDEKPQP